MITLEKGYMFAGYINGVQVGSTTKPVSLSIITCELAGCVPCSEGVDTHDGDECPSVTFIRNLTTHGYASSTIAYLDEITGRPQSEGMEAIRVPVQVPPVSLAEWLLASFDADTY